MKQRNILIKICGLKDLENIKNVSSLEPDFMGFVLFKGSPRWINLKDVERLAAFVPSSIMKVGVLVDEPLDNAIEIARSGIFDLLQLHGNETVNYCMTISEFTGVIKAFHISNELPFDLGNYEPYCKMFLFDTGGNKFGGLGKKFDHSLLSGYSSANDYLLSGGISPADAEYIRSCHYIGMAGADLNSRFESEPGIKDIELLEHFIKKVRNNDGIN